MNQADVNAAYDSLAAQVTKNTDAEAGAVTILNGLAARITAAVSAAIAATPTITPAQLAGISAEATALQTSAGALGAAVVANTPAA